MEEKEKNVVVLSYVDKNINCRVGEGEVYCQSHFPIKTVDSSFSTSKRGFCNISPITDFISSLYNYVSKF